MSSMMDAAQAKVSPALDQQPTSSSQLSRASNRLRRLAVPLELALIVLAAALATAKFLDPNPALQVPGGESEWLTSAVQSAAADLREYGYLPLWQPYLNRGEPLIDNPFSMVLNPISSAPSFIFGARAGLRYSVVLSTILAGLGGWLLARTLGLGGIGRVLLGLLMVGKGNMAAMIGAGYFQLGVSQAYIPWVIAGTLGVLREKQRRYPIVLTAIMLTLMFWAGNIYYLLPALMSILGLGLTHIIRVERRRARIDGAALRRLVGAGVLTLGLSAVTLLPIFLNQRHIGGHPGERGMGTYADLGLIVRLFFDGSLSNYDNGALAGGGPQFYQSFVLPAWFFALIFVLLPIRRLHRGATPKAWQVWSVGLFMLVFCTLWGAGQNPIVGWLYAHVPLMNQWRFVGRMLAIVSFWLAVLAAMRVDGLWRAIVEQSWRRFARAALAVGLIAASLFAAAQVIGQWRYLAAPGEFVVEEDTCIAWLRLKYPDKILSVWSLNYDNVTVYLDNHVRHANITADFFVIGDPPTFPTPVFTRFPPEFGSPWSDNDVAYLRENGYVPMADSPVYFDRPCLWRKPDAIPYAFTILPVDLLNEALDVRRTTTIESVRQYPDRIFMTVTAQPDRPLIAVVQEVAYPGWTVEMDGRPAKLESIGRLIGVMVPPGQHAIAFAYRPPLLFLGGAITLMTALASALYLLGAEGRLRRRHTSFTNTP